MSSSSFKDSSNKQDIMTDNNDIGEKETELYDRQLRLWGFEAQKRMQQSRILFCGVTGLQIEAAKNLVLAGVSVVLQDNTVLRADDLSALYFASQSDIGTNRAVAVQKKLQALNSYVTVDIEVKAIEDIPDDYLTAFSVIVATDISEIQALRLDSLCRSADLSFIHCGSYGEQGWFALDLAPSFTFQHDPPRNTKVETLVYPSLEDIWAVKWADLKKKHFPVSDVFVRSRILSAFREAHGRLPCESDFATVQALTQSLLVKNNLPEDFLSSEDIERNLCRSSYSQLMPVCSIVGGFLSQEIVKAVSRVGVPMHNVFVYSLADSVGRAFSTSNAA